jgi:hypothetical protein
VQNPLYEDADGEYPLPLQFQFQMAYHEHVVLRTQTACSH